VVVDSFVVDLAELDIDEKDPIDLVVVQEHLVVQLAFGQVVYSTVAVLLAEDIGLDTDYYWLAIHL